MLLPYVCGVVHLQLRHPNVLAFKDSIEVQEKGQHVVYLVTQAVRPLITVLKELNLAGQHRQASSVCAGTHSSSSSYQAVTSVASSNTQHPLTCWPRMHACVSFVTPASKHRHGSSVCAGTHSSSSSAPAVSCVVCQFQHTTAADACRLSRLQGRIPRNRCPAHDQRRQLPQQQLQHGEASSSRLGPGCGSNSGSRP